MEETDHSSWELCNHGHVYCDVIPFFHPNAPKVVGNLAYRDKQLLIGQRRRLANIVALQIEGYLFALPIVDVPVQAVVAHIGLCPNEIFNADWSFVVIKIPPAKPLMPINQTVDDTGTATFQLDGIVRG